eukprot:g7939.t1
MAGGSASKLAVIADTGHCLPGSCSCVARRRKMMKHCVCCFPAPDGLSRLFQLRLSILKIAVRLGAVACLLRRVRNLNATFEVHLYELSTSRR